MYSINLVDNDLLIAIASLFGAVDLANRSFFHLHKNVNKNKILQLFSLHIDGIPRQIQINYCSLEEKQCTELTYH